MTGRPSGRCAATEALERIVEGSVDPWVRQAARAALASPCCVSAADQEQVKEALRVARGLARGIYDGRMESGDSPADPVNVELLAFVDEFTAALALLGNEEEER